MKTQTLYAQISDQNTLIDNGDHLDTIQSSSESLESSIAVDDGGGWYLYAIYGTNGCLCCDGAGRGPGSNVHKLFTQQGTDVYCASLGSGTLKLAFENAGQIVTFTVDTSYEKSTRRFIRIEPK